MPISLSAKSSLRKSIRNNRENSSFREKIKTIVKAFLVKPSLKGLKEVYSILDKSVKKGIFHKNKVARLKTKYSKVINKPEVEKTKVVVKKKAVKKRVVKKTAKKMS